ncbi:MAG: pantetheine-phosphate adenylyltransferase [Dehalococcoidia bacterium]|nr:pantetheine-phosphate adenylyltransferase [Dehalococcoidia bacterium]
MKSVCMGGTFDVFHAGHEVLIQRALDVSEHVLIGLTTDERAGKGRTGSVIIPYAQRKSGLEHWLRSKGVKQRVEIVPLDDDWGPAALGEDFEGIIVSVETEGMARALNQVREGKGVDKLEVVVVPIVMAYDGHRISSSRIRNGEINSEGLRT